MVRTVLYLINPERYFEGVVSIFKHEIGDRYAVYVTTNKPYNHIINLFKEEGIDTSRIFFIDCITREVSTGKIPEPPNCLFVESLQDMTAIAIAINTGIEHLPGHKILLLDSLSTLLLYNDSKVVGQFSNFLLNKLRIQEMDGIMLALESDMDHTIIKTIESFMDEVRKCCPK
ncbi:MAG: hypothetical protein V1744_08275 [Candidatus Altiarchaeota archaeon]